MKQQELPIPVGRCRYCDSALSQSFVDLGMSPLSNAFVRTEHYHRVEPFYPLHAYVCSSCFLVQLEQFESPQQIFSDYVYFSSYSDSWLRHAQQYAGMAIERFRLDSGSLVVEVASNDGYLLKHFKERGIAVLGIEPAENVARVAVAAGIPTLTRFFGAETAAMLTGEGRQADLLVGNNVLAHVPDINDFVSGLKRLLKPEGVLTMEFPHLYQLMAHNQFDTIYHEHFSYISFMTVARIFRSHGLTLFDVDELPTHGGSLRIYAGHSEDTARKVMPSVERLQQLEYQAGLADVRTYARFSERVRETKRALLEFLIQAKRAGKSIVGYGAAAKGNTLLNYCGIRGDFIDYVVDRSPHKHGLFLPGTRIPVFAPEKVAETRPDYLLVLPWNIQEEVIEQMRHVRQWGGQFVVPIPTVQVIA